MDLFNMPKCCSNRRTRVLEKNIENLDLNTCSRIPLKMLNSVSKAIEYSTISSNYETYTNNTIKK